jgi:hypothetical protein
LILEAAQQPVWRDLLDAGEFKLCSPALGRMTRIEPALRALGYSF